MYMPPTCKSVPNCVSRVLRTSRSQNRAERFASIKYLGHGSLPNGVCLATCRSAEGCKVSCPLAMNPHGRCHTPPCYTASHTDDIEGASQCVYKSYRSQRNYQSGLYSHFSFSFFLVRTQGRDESRTTKMCSRITKQERVQKPDRTNLGVSPIHLEMVFLCFIYLFMRKYVPYACPQLS